MINNLLNLLDKVKQVRNGEYKACCPAHEDKNPSLSITEKDDKILIKCWAGCSTEEVLNSLGLTWNDLFYEALCHGDRKNHHARHNRNEIFKEKTILALANTDRKSGIKLNRSDMEREKVAYLRVDNANNNK